MSENQFFKNMGVNGSMGLGSIGGPMAGFAIGGPIGALLFGIAGGMVGLKGSKVILDSFVKDDAELMGKLLVDEFWKCSEDFILNL